MSGLSYALDMAEGQPAGHALRTTIIGMRIATHLGLSDDQRSALFYSLLLKDLGGSSNAAQFAALFGADDRLLKRAHRLTDWTDPRESRRFVFEHKVAGAGKFIQAWRAFRLSVRARESMAGLLRTKCERGAAMARTLGLPNGTADAIRTTEEHWDGRGLPNGLSGSGIPMLGRIVSLAQTVETFHSAYDSRTAIEMAHTRRGRWFDPVVVDCLSAFQTDNGFWAKLQQPIAIDTVIALEPAEFVIFCGDDRLDVVAQTFGDVVDSKSEFTTDTSRNVARLAVAMGEAMGMTAAELKVLERSALLHDLGKLGIANTILDKPGALDEGEVDAVRAHTHATVDILERTPRFSRLAATAASHHERLDGTGYHLGLAADNLNLTARILAVADSAVAVASPRAYRAAFAADEVIPTLQPQVAAGRLCPAAMEALEGVL